MAYTATLSNGVYHRGGEFDGNIDFHIVFEPEVPLAAVLDNLRVSRPGEPCPLEILAYAESGGGFDLTVFDEFFPYEEGKTVEVAWRDQSLGTLDLELDECEESESTPPSNSSGCGTSIVLLGAGFIGLFAKYMTG